MSTSISRWFEWDTENEKWTFNGTENYVFNNAGNVSDLKKRIGDMTREELIHVIATTFEQRDQTAIPGLVKSRDIETIKAEIKARPDFGFEVNDAYAAALIAFVDLCNARISELEQRLEEMTDANQGE